MSSVPLRLCSLLAASHRTATATATATATSKFLPPPHREPRAPKPALPCDGGVSGRKERCRCRHPSHVHVGWCT
ncbi:uncharacterized protein IWZ02DRAFT_460029 [Phyllosticta citriasiana]|uniref:uncharacterized protein n=1 Tax=Phyllosticta citriasiana TaxID=595635 RepID=UPI0030FD4A68